jgi:hypothetical protein
LREAKAMVWWLFRNIVLLIPTNFEYLRLIDTEEDCLSFSRRSSCYISFGVVLPPCAVQPCIDAHGSNGQNVSLCIYAALFDTMGRMKA